MLDTTIKVDVLVIGGGPAGSMAAMAAAKAGAKTLLVEKQARIGLDPRCAEWVPQALGLELDLPRAAVVQKVRGMELRLQQWRGEVAMPGLMLERRLFDFELARRAAQAGAEIWSATRLESLEPGHARLGQGSRGLDIAFQSLVAADGAASKVAACMGLTRQPLMAALNWQVPLRLKLEQTLVYLRPQYRLGYAWLFPKGKTANLGLGCTVPSGLRNHLGALHKELAEQGLVGTGILGVSAGALPVGGPRGDIFREGVFFCGDAAGLTHPVTGAGIPQALDSGQKAGKAAAALAQGDQDAGPGYAREVLQRWGAYVQRGLVARRKQDENWKQGDFRGLMARTWPAWPKKA